MPHTLPDLGYNYDALEPFIDAQTMEIHHTKHHKGYVTKLNAALEKHSDLVEKPVNELIRDLTSIPDDIKKAVQNNGGGHSNHSFFWPLLKKDVQMTGRISDEINKTFGSLEKFKEQFSNSAATVFGSGWAWLVLNGDKLEIITTSNQDSPLTQGQKPILGLDVWEHAYYLKYQNKRPDYIEAFFNVINWSKVNENLEKASN